ncbi:adenylate kinase isoenzyme 5-like [Melanotaenia boesemani]|uniref:adenylate kinase isoenzyme 5-like n=1 Tax=Melanotaenia boesemani TaxID=1250792 RepID=UPI001C03A5CC|nr:adenylate kinase isoenzyme 5-like [Melanotaenia boesemani]
MSEREVKEYLSQHHISQLLESLLTGLLYHRPDDPISFLQSSLTRAKQQGGPGAVTWDTFIHLERDQLELASPKIKPQTGTLLTPITSPTLSPVLPAIPQLHPTPPPLPQLHSTRFKTSVPPSSLLPLNEPRVCLPVRPRLPVDPLRPARDPSAHKAFPPAPPRPSGTPPTHRVSPTAFPELLGDLAGHVGAVSVHTEVMTPDAKTLSKGVSPPALRTQLSIDSDSDMTESSGLRQELNILAHLRPHPLIIFVLGGPGSGKGSQTAKLTHHFGLQGVSLDKLLQKQLLSNASTRRKWEIISEMMSHGELGPQEDTVPELRKQLTGQQEVQGFVVDGFPQDIHQALSFQEQVGSPDLVLLLLCSNETLCCRLQRRAMSLGLLGDSSTALHRRLDRFERDIVSISRYYKQLHLLIQVDGNRDEETVFADLSSVIRKKLFLKDQSGAADPVAPFSSLDS